MRDQRCLYRRMSIEQSICQYVNLLTQTSSNYRMILNQMITLVIRSAYLSPKCQCWRSRNSVNNSLDEY